MHITMMGKPTLAYPASSAFPLFPHASKPSTTPNILLKDRPRLCQTLCQRSPEVSTPFVTRICNLDMMCERCMHTVSYSPVIFNVSFPYGQVKLISPLFYGFRLFCAHFPYFLSLLVPLRLEHTFYRTLPHVFLDAPSIYPRVSEGLVYCGLITST